MKNLSSIVNLSKKYYNLDLYKCYILRVNPDYSLCFNAAILTLHTLEEYVNLHQRSAQYYTVYLRVEKKYKRYSPSPPCNASVWYAIMNLI